MEWPDKGLPYRLATGFEMGGDVSVPGILRPIVPEHVGRGLPPDAHQHLLGASAVERINDIERSREPPQTFEIWKLTAEEIRDGRA